MKRMTPKSPGPSDVDELLTHLIAGAQGDHEQLGALARGIGEALDLPLDVHVVGEPLCLVALDYAGNSRRGIVACCRREDGAEYAVSLADVALPTNAPGRLHIDAYRQWLGAAPATERTQGIASAARRHTHQAPQQAGDDDLDLSRPVELVVLAVKQRAARCRLLGSERVITLRAGSLRRLIPGQVATVQPHKQWRHNGHPYLSGEIVSARIDAEALGLPPLALHPQGEWDPAEHYWGEDDEPIEAWAKPIIERGPRPLFEMEQVLPGSDPDDFDDPILEANELKDAGDAAGARELLLKLLEADLRCLDAHAHLGNLEFPLDPVWALNHYEIGVRLGELALGKDFNGVLEWGLLDNRPFLRCMHGYGLCLWRLKRWAEAEQVFERLLWLNPADNQGNCLLLPDVRARQAWVDDDG